MQVDRDLQITRRHLSRLKEMLLERWARGSLNDFRGAPRPYLKKNDIVRAVRKAAAAGEFEPNTSVAERIGGAVEGVRKVVDLVDRHTSPRRARSETEEEEGNAQSVVLIGGVRRGILGRDERRPETSEEQAGITLIECLWRIVGVRSAGRVLGLSAAKRKGRLPEVIFDRLLEGLLWRLPRPSMGLLGGGEVSASAIREAMGERLGSRPGAEEAEQELPSLVEDWKQCCWLAAEINEPPRNRTWGDAKRRASSTTATDWMGGEPAVQEQSQPVSLRPSNEGPKGVTTSGLFQTLRAIRKRMRLGDGALEQNRAWTTLQVLLGEAAEEILRDHLPWKRCWKMMARK